MAAISFTLFTVRASFSKFCRRSTSRLASSLVDWTPTSKRNSPFGAFPARKSSTSGRIISAVISNWKVQPPWFLIKWPKISMA
ncbi:hypothetical protein D3C75_1210790 [compost metagenome]